MKINLIIDGNYILNKNVFPLHKNNELYGGLEENLKLTFSTYKNLHHFSKIYFISDSKGYSWRKNLYPEYKGNRSKSEDIDWEFVFETYTNFKEDMPKNVHVLEKPTIEGDDWIAYTVLESNKKGYSNLIISNDYDLKQLLDFKTDPLYINIMSNEMFNREKVFLPENYNIFLNELNKVRHNTDLFNLNFNNEHYSFLQSFIESREKVVVNKVRELLSKVISGDSSDNIKSVYLKETNTGKIRGIGKKGSLNILDKYEEEFGELDLNSEDLYENLADIICEVKKESYLKLDEIKENIEFNMSLINLYELPKHIIDEMSIVRDKIK